MKKTENTKTVENNDLQIIGKKFVFVINNDEQTEKTEKASIAFLEWIKTSKIARSIPTISGLFPAVGVLIYQM